MTPLIESLTLQGYRRFEKLELDGFGRVNVLVGDNNAGKTSVLEAIALLADPVNPQTWKGISEGRSVWAFSTLSRTDALRWLFRQQNGVDSNKASPSLSLSWSKGGIARSARATLARATLPLNPPSARAMAGLREPHIESLTLSVNVTDGTRDGELTIFVPSKTTETIRQEAEWDSGFEPTRWILFSPHEHLVDALLVTGVSEATKTQTKGRVVELLRRFAPITDIALLESEQLSVFVLDERAGWVPVSSLGEGLRRCLALALSLVSVRGGVLLVDEIETAIHRSMLETVFGWLTAACKEYDVQLFCTTHSLEAVDALVESAPASEGDANDIVLFRLPESQSGGIARRFDHKKISRLREDGIEVR